MMHTSGYATPHGYIIFPPEADRQTSSVSCTVTHTPTNSQPSSSSTSQLGMSSLHLQGNGSEPNTPTTNQSATPDDVVGIISQIINDLYRDAFPTWARKKDKKPQWILSEDRKKLLGHRANDPRFKHMSKIGKKDILFTKGGSLYTSEAQSQGNVRRKLETEAFKETHIGKKKNTEDPEMWVEL
ncbi:hypothetical protein KY290_000751 [Solanum tuberosum]|uniref:Uncharacterized protein n=1 Tax=Solanum tuberosum TaxID=4113 RepID=A0ABQ7WM57_SOLTU|nr:hypothetical protein KY289_000814 [Solanum tuberosum]KAH0781153.1 hypothetical protein KY290_000751 [Solanum tuberosum]